MTRLDEIEKRLDKLEMENAMMKEVINEMADDLWIEVEDDYEECDDCKYCGSCCCPMDCCHCSGYCPEDECCDCDDDELSEEEIKMYGDDYECSEKAYIDKCVEFYETYMDLKKRIKKEGLTLELLKDLEKFADKLK